MANGEPILPNVTPRNCLDKKQRGQRHELELASDYHAFSRTSKSIHYHLGACGIIQYHRADFWGGFGTA
ncbi:hypothetical protein [Moraxella lacunata]|uniref:hypothetical protein n=1 Tax=Moraxella lacunata TaxID=477 RepID=UPI003EE200F6